MSHTGPGTHERPTPIRRLWDAIVLEFTPPPTPFPRKSEEQLAEGHLAVGTIDDAIEESPGSDVVGPATLIIIADVPGHGILRRRAPCPLPMPCSGHRLVGQSVPFRHTTFDPDFVNEALVVEWPPEVSQALEPFRPEGPGALRARVWRLLANCSAVVAVGGILLTVALFIGMVFTGGELFADLPAWFRPGVVLTASVGAVVLELFAITGCDSRVWSALSRPRSPEGRGSDKARATNAKNRPEELTDREQEFLILIARGPSNIEIASELTVTMRTVKAHIGALLFNLHSLVQAQLVITAYSHGLVNEDVGG